MKTSGIVRRLDDLGRIVIPKEVRVVIGAREGTPMEIFYDKDEGIYLKKYLPEEDLLSMVESMSDVVEYQRADLGTEKAAEIRRHIRQLKELLQEMK